MTLGITLGLWRSDESGGFLRLLDMLATQVGVWRTEASGQMLYVHQDIIFHRIELSTIPLERIDSRESPMPIAAYRSCASQVGGTILDF